jgi:hypothetical protein
LTPLLFIIAALLLVINTLKDNLVQQPIKTFEALGIIALGVPAYFIWRSRGVAVPDDVVSQEGD